MYSYLRTKAPWIQLIIFFALSLGCMFAITLVGALIVSAANGTSAFAITKLTQADYGKPEWTGFLRGMLVVQFFIFAVPALLFAYFADPNPLPYAGLKRPDRKYYILLGIVIIVCSGFMVEWLAHINEVVVNKFASQRVKNWIDQGESDVSSTLQSILTMKTTAQLIQSILLVAVLPAIGEELFFRGIMQRLFIRLFKSPWAGIIVTGALFSAFHMQFLGFLPRMILGIILGALYWYSGSLYPAIIGHFVFNGAQVLLIYFHKIDANASVTDTSGMLLMGIGSVIVVGALLYYLRRQSSTRYETVFFVPPDELPWDPDAPDPS